MLLYLGRATSAGDGLLVTVCWSAGLLVYFCWSISAGLLVIADLFNLRYTAKSLSREAKKSDKSAADNKIKCKKAMEVGNMDGARIFAESAIRDKNTALNYLRLSSRIDAVAQRVNTACKMKTLTKDMSGIVNSMDSVMKTMNVEKISAVMDQFERQFEDLDLTTGVMENSIAQSTANTMPESQVDTLMQQVADEYGLEFAGHLASPIIQVPKKKEEVPTAGKLEEQKQVVVESSKESAGTGTGTGAGAGAGGTEESLEERLRRLQGM